jgi:hypothetical protein
MRRLHLLFFMGLAAVCIQSCASKPAQTWAGSAQPATVITLSGELAVFGNEPFAWLGIRQVQGLDAPLVKLVFSNPAELLQWRDFQNKRVSVQGALIAPELSTPQVQVHSIALQP